MQHSITPHTTRIFISSFIQKISSMDILRKKASTACTAYLVNIIPLRIKNCYALIFFKFLYNQINRAFNIFLQVSIQLFSFVLFQLLGKLRDKEEFLESKQIILSKMSKTTTKICRCEYWICSEKCGMMCGYKGGVVMAKRRPLGDGMVRKRDDGTADSFPDKVLSDVRSAIYTPTAFPLLL